MAEQRTASELWMDGSDIAIQAAIDCALTFCKRREPRHTRKTLSLAISLIRRRMFTVAKIFPVRGEVLEDWRHQQNRIIVHLIWAGRYLSRPAAVASDEGEKP